MSIMRFRERHMFSPPSIPTAERALIELNAHQVIIFIVILLPAKICPDMEYLNVTENLCNPCEFSLTESLPAMFNLA